MEIIPGKKWGKEHGEGSLVKQGELHNTTAGWEQVGAHGDTAAPLQLLPVPFFKHQRRTWRDLGQEASRAASALGKALLAVLWRSLFHHLPPAFSEHLKDEQQEGDKPQSPASCHGRTKRPPTLGTPPGARVGARLHPWPRGAGCGDLQPGRALGTAARAAQEFRAPEVIGEGGRGADGATSLPLRAAPAPGGASTGTRAGRGTMLLLISDND